MYHLKGYCYALSKDAFRCAVVAYLKKKILVILQEYIQETLSVHLAGGLMLH